MRGLYDGVWSNLSLLAQFWPWILSVGVAKCTP